jgi:hypothetical protein
MPADESVEQHIAKRKEEIAAVELDKSSSEGLFKGCFPRPRPALVYDDEDNVVRCPSCGHEHEGGPACTVCGQELDEDLYGMSDAFDEEAELEDLEDFELEEIESEFAEIHGFHHSHVTGIAARHQLGFDHRHTRMSIDQIRALRSEEEDDDDETTDSEAGSMNDFIVEDRHHEYGNGPDASSPNAPITISDDDSDEGGEVSNRRPRRRGRRGAISPTPSVITLTASSTKGSEADDRHSEAERLIEAGWSPLHQGVDNDGEPSANYRINHYHQFFDAYGHPPAESSDGQDSDDDSDTNTETMVDHGNMSTVSSEPESEYEGRPLGDIRVPVRDLEDSEDDSDEEENESNMSIPPFSPTPSDATPAYQGYNAAPFDPESFRYYPFPGSSDVGNDSDADNESNVDCTDHDGDTEMSASPRASRESRSVSLNPYNNVLLHQDAHQLDNRSRRSAAAERIESTNAHETESQVSDISHYGMGENLGAASQVNEINETSDDSPRPARRRRPRQYGAQNQTPAVRQYDQQAPLSNSTEYDESGYYPGISTSYLQQPFENLVEDFHAARPGDFERRIQALEAAHRSTRSASAHERQTTQDRMTAYRNQSTRRVDPLRSSRSPSSASRIISSSQRNSRVPRQYNRSRASSSQASGANALPVGTRQNHRQYRSQI